MLHWFLTLIEKIFYPNPKVNNKIEEFYKELNNSSNKEYFLKTQSKKYLKYIDKDCGHFFVYDSYPAFVHVWENYYYRNYHLYQSNIDLSSITNKNFNKSILKTLKKIY